MYQKIDGGDHYCGSRKLRSDDPFLSWRKRDHVCVDQQLSSLRRDFIRHKAAKYYRGEENQRRRTCTTRYRAAAAAPVFL